MPPLQICADMRKSDVAGTGRGAAVAEVVATAGAEVAGTAGT